ncbi:hypothetical protein SANT12839_068140 [Streptomyces antimycoticus]|uniref:Uncharacterized protein n=1 Tax=Streptomyces antimycoticus TaxID=68175 RepID=A0A4D4KC94_9ACTN|nr:hypothetical protein SANT12839_068140 [Streptomyces antimycoticus]
MIAGNSVWAGAGEAGSRGVAAVDTRGGRLAWPYTQGTEGRWALSAAGNRVFMLHNRTLTAMPVFQPHRPAPSARQPPPAPPPDQRAPTLVIPPAPAHPPPRRWYSVCWPFAYASPEAPSLGRQRPADPASRVTEDPLRQRPGALGG